MAINQELPFDPGPEYHRRREARAKTLRIAELKDAVVEAARAAYVYKQGCNDPSYLEEIEPLWEAVRKFEEEAK
jgi:hypothetical protein